MFLLTIPIHINECQILNTLLKEYAFTKFLRATTTTTI